jgi:flagella basal body P-ring formation protein FlgA
MDLLSLLLASTLGAAGNVRPDASRTFERAVEEAACDRARAAVRPPDRFEIARARIEGRPPRPAGPFRLELASFRGPNRSGLVEVAFRILSEAGETGTVRVAVLGRVRGPAVSARTRLLGGAPIPAGSVEIADADLTRLASPPLREPSEAVGLAPRRTLGPGTVLAAALLGPPIRVRRGQSVELRIEGAGLTVRARGRARAAGAVGETVMAENETTGALLFAEVQEDGSLRVTAPVRSRSSR